jgi:hypothetical protein
MKKIIAFSIFIISLLFISSNLHSRISENLNITNGFDALYVEKESYDTIKSNLDQEYSNIEYGVYQIEEDAINFYVSDPVDFDQLNTDKEINIADINEYNNVENVEKYLYFYIGGDVSEVEDFYNEFEQYLIESNNSMPLNSRIISMESHILYSSKLPVYESIINVTILFISSIVLLYVFIHFNNKSKSFAINKLYGVNFLEKLDVAFIFICLILSLMLNLYYSLYLIILICLIYLIKYYLFYKCRIIKSINGKPIVNNFEILILFYNTVMKILVFSFYILFLFLIPRITEYYSTYELWKNVEDYSITDNAFVECCGNKEDATDRDSTWRSDYYKFMNNNYDAILIPVDAGGSNSFTGNDYEVSKRFFEIQDIDLNIDESKGALVVRDINSESTKQIIDTIKETRADDDALLNIPIIEIGDKKVYTFDPILGYDTKLTYIVFPSTGEQAKSGSSYVLNSNQIIYKNVNQDNQPLESFYESVGLESTIDDVDPSFYELGQTQIDQFRFITSVAIICFIFILFINLFLTKNIIDMYEEKNIKLNTVRKILGYSNYEVHKNFYLTYHFIDGLIAVAIIIASLFLGFFLFGILIAMFHLITSLLSSYLYISKNENNKIVEALKGKI